MYQCTIGPCLLEQQYFKFFPSNTNVMEKGNWNRKPVELVLLPWLLLLVSTKPTPMMAHPLTSRKQFSVFLYFLTTKPSIYNLLVLSPFWQNLCFFFLFWFYKVCLHDWWLIKAGKDFEGKRLAVAGFTSRE